MESRLNVYHMLLFVPDRPRFSSLGYCQLVDVQTSHALGHDFLAVMKVIICYFEAVLVIFICFVLSLFLEKVTHLAFALIFIL